MKNNAQLTDGVSSPANTAQSAQTATSRPFRRGKKIPRTVHFDPIVLEAMEAHMKRERIENFSVAALDAIKFSLFPEHREDRDAGTTKLLNQILYSLNEHRRKTSRDMTIFQEILVRFVHEYFMHTHQIPDSAKKEAEIQANLRLDDFMKQIIRRLPNVKKAADGNET